MTFDSANPAIESVSDDHPAQLLDSYDNQSNGKTIIHDGSNPRAWIAADYEDVTEISR